MRPSHSVVVLGYGNPLRRDDGAGWRVAEAVAARWADRVTVRIGQQIVPEWAADLADADVAFIVDASVTWSTRLRLLRLEPVADEALLDGHALGPAQLLGLATLVYQRQPAAYLLQLPAEDLSLGETLTPTAAAGCQRALRLLNRRLARLV